MKTNLQKRLDALEQATSGRETFVILLGGIDELANDPDVIDIAPPEEALRLLVPITHIIESRRQNTRS